MTKRTQFTIYTMLTNEINGAIAEQRLAQKEGCLHDIDYWTNKLNDARAALMDIAAECDSIEAFRLYKQTEEVKQLLESCMDVGGADITITVKRDDGRTATAELYDHAALVQGLWDALDYFQSEL
jgi:hypothetical protein